ncbi:hypothetical protein ACKVWC_001922 [Pyricularia oryzae]
MHIAAFKNTATPESGFLFNATIKGRPESENPANEPTSNWTASVEGILASPHDSATDTAGGRRIIFQVQNLFCVSLVPSEGPYRDGIFTEEIWAPDPEYALRELELEPEGLGDKAHLQTVEELTHYYIYQIYQGFSREEAKSDKTQWFIKRLWQWLDHIVGVNNGKTLFIPSVEPFRNPWAEDPDRFRRLMERIEPIKNLVEIQILQAVANNILRIMRQEEGPTILEMLFKDDMLGRLYREPAVYARVNRYLGRAAKAISHRFPRCDIIEVGAGTGGGTQAMFNGLRGAYHSYTFTDISSGFFTQAKVKFAAEVDRMVFKTLDVEKDAVEQGFSPAAYDIVVASNVLHATKDIGNSLANIRKLLKPGGYLLLIEVTAVDKVLVPFLMGAVPGWWLFQDKWRAGTFSPFLTPTGWDTVLRESGYDTGTENLFHDMSTPDNHLSNVIVARATDADWMDFQSCRTAPSSRFHSESIIVVASPDTYDRDAGPCISRQVAVDLSDSLFRFYNRHATEVEHAGKQPIITIVDSLDKALASPGFDKSVLVVLSDLDHPIMNGITPAAWEALKSTLGRIFQPIVWATRQRLCSGNPHQNMLVGMGRCARYKNPGLVLRFVDLDCSDRSCPGPAAMRTLAREVWQANFKTSARGSWLGSDGKETLGFLLPHGFKKVSEAGFLGRADLNNSFGSGFLEIPKLEKEALSARMQRIANLAAAAVLSVTQKALNRDEIKQTGLIDWSAPMDDEGPPRILENPRHLFSPDKTYLFAGITSDLGLSMVKWLIENGARKIALTNRTPKLPKLWLDEMAALGAKVFSFAMDVTDAVSVQIFCSEIEASMGPVAGVVFGAMVLKDTLLESMPFDTLQSVLAPKVQGSRHVEAYFAHRALDFFIFMSSMSAIVGIRGQSNYCAGNMYGKALVRARRARGQAASTIDLSTVFGVGHFANAGRETLDAVRANLRGFNTLPIGVPDVLAAFHEAVLRGRPDAPGTGDVIVGLGSEEAVAGPHQPPVPAAWHGDPRFGYFTARASQRLMQDATAQSQGAGAARDGSRDVRKKLAAETTDQGRLATLSKCFALAVAETMQLPEGTPPRLDVRLMDYGIDSLVAMDLRAWFLRELEVSVPVLSILNGESIRELCKTVWSQMQSQ